MIFIAKNDLSEILFFINNLFKNIHEEMIFLTAT